MALNVDRKVLIVGGAMTAVLAGAAVALFAGGERTDRTGPPPAAQGGLVVEMGRQDDGKLDASRPLRCFVSGQFVGEVTLAECAKRNGVATGALDVGLDQSGALAASDQADVDLTPLPPPQAEPVVQPTTESQPSPPSAACLRYEGGQWVRLAGEYDRSRCVEALYAGRCEVNSGASYGRWGEQTLRLTNGRIETSADNRRFQTLASSVPGCGPTSSDGAGR